MAALLEEETVPYPQLRRGEIIEGVVVGSDRGGILVDIGAKSEGVVPPHEMHCLRPEGPSSLQPGDKVLVFVLQPESPEGQIILSMDRARGERGWRILQEYMEQNKAFEGYVTGSNKGGLLINLEGVNAFVPLSQIVAGPERGSTENMEKALFEWVGRTIHLKVIELNRRRNRAILSERAAVQERRASEKERLLQELQEGDIRTGRITSIRDFGIFVDIGGADGLVHLSELSWERTPRSPHELFKVSDEVEVYVLKVDQENKKIALSVRRAQPERWEEIVSRYREGQIVPGQVTKLAPFGAFVRLEGPIEGLVHISELVDRRVNYPKEVVDEGDVIPVKIVRIEHDRHRLGLSLRQARDKAEEDGWAFNDNGGVVSAVPEALARLGIEAAPGEAVPEAEAAAPATPAKPVAEAEPDVEAEAVAEAEVGAPDEVEAAPEAELHEAAETEAGGAEEPLAEEAEAAVEVGADAEPEAEALPVKVEEDTEAEAELPPETEPEIESEVVIEEPEVVVEAAQIEAAEGEAEEPTVTEEQSEALNRRDDSPAEAESVPTETDAQEPDTSGEREGGN